MHILYEMLHFGDILHTIVILPTNTGLSHRPLPIFKNYMKKKPMKKGKNVFKKYVQSIFNNSWKTNYVYMLDI